MDFYLCKFRRCWRYLQLKREKFNNLCFEVSLTPPLAFSTTRFQVKRNKHQNIWRDYSKDSQQLRTFGLRRSLQLSNSPLLSMSMATAFSQQTQSHLKSLLYFYKFILMKSFLSVDGSRQCPRALTWVGTQTPTMDTTLHENDRKCVIQMSHTECRRCLVITPEGPTRITIHWMGFKFCFDN